ncbi:MAG: YraN family protein [Bacteroidales bacterium]|nr:YraN family protein [Bacteroidales bacterium]
MEFVGTNQVGSWGETKAREYLESKSYEILETNWHCSHREIDIIAQKDGVIVIVEVKTRTTTFQNPTVAVDKQKQKFLISAANRYVQMKKLDADVRFDIVSIVAVNGNVTIEHIENAFYPRLR